MKPVVYMQGGGFWGQLLYTITNNIKQTIASSGCGITCMAMILATWVNSKITPKDMRDLALKFGDRTANDGTEWEFFGHIATMYKLKYKQSGSLQEAIEAIKQGAYVVCSMGPGYFTKGGHYILAYAIAGNGDIIVNNPSSTVKTQASQAIFKSQCKQYFIFWPPVKTTKTMTITQDLNVRPEPNTTCKPIAIKTTGSKVEVMVVDNGWAKIVYNNGTAYVSAKYLK